MMVLEVTLVMPWLTLYVQLAENQNGHTMSAHFIVCRSTIVPPRGPDALVAVAVESAVRGAWSMLSALANNLVDPAS